MMNRPPGPERTKVSAEELGHTLAGVVLTDVPLLVKELEPELPWEPGHIPIISRLASRLARKMTGPTPALLRLFVECLVFDWFLIDLRVAGRFGPRAEGIRQGMADYIMKAPHRIGVLPDDVSRDAFEDMRIKRFTEYHRALEGTKLVWGALASVAWERMGGQRSFVPHTRLMTHGPSMFKLCDEFCSEAEITE
jgi:hypothetical protein